MFTKENLTEINKKILSIDVKGKNYVMVNERVKAFREICPSGTIETEILNLENGVVTMKAVVKDEEGHTIGTGLAQEKETNGYINKTSFIENCETSAVGRALGFAGIGVDTSMASAEEVANAILQQETAKKKIGAAKVNVLKADIENGVFDKDKLLAWFKVEKLEDVTEGQFAEYVQKKTRNDRNRNKDN